MNWNILWSNVLDHKMWKYKVALSNYKYNNKHCNSDSVISDCSKFIQFYLRYHSEVRNASLDYKMEL